VSHTHTALLVNYTRLNTETSKQTTALRASADLRQGDAVPSDFQGAVKTSLSKDIFVVKF